MWRSVVEVIPDRLKKTWERQNIRGVVLLSLLLQTILILGAPFRKRTGKKWVILLIWLSYLFADWAASFAVGLISNSQNSKPGENSDLLAFWAPFLLLHLGGPDTITAFALEDNELWLRHFLSLVFQVVATVYVFLQTLPDNNLWLATLLMFFAGIIKYAERTRSLYLASLGRFRESMLKEPDPGPNYAKLMEEYSSKKDAGLPTEIDLTAEPDKESKVAFFTVKEDRLNDFEVVEYAYHFFKIFKGLIVDLIFSFRERNESRAFFQARTSEDALRVIEVELNFIYEVLYTKVVVVHDVKGYFFRVLSSTSIWVALGLFISLDKPRLRKFDIGVTYTLLIGALCLELLALYMLIFSDWTIASLKKTRNFPIVGTIFKIYLKIKSSRWAECKEGSDTIFSKLATPIILRRWSESVSGFNLITYCLKERPKTFHEVKVESWFGITKWIGYLKIIWEYCWKKVVDHLGAKDFLDELKYVASKPFKKNLWQFIFSELLQKSKDADDAESTRRICSARGAYVLEEYGKVDIDKKLIAEYIENVNFDESLLLWHIATELCYEKEVNKGDHPAKQGGIIHSVRRWIHWLWHNAKEISCCVKKVGDDAAKGSKTDGSVKMDGNANDSAGTATSTADDLTTADDHREFSKLLSDYMLYLLVMQPTMMSAVAGIGEIRFRDTCAEAEKFFSRRGLRPTQEYSACENLLDVNTDVKPIHVKGDRSKSVLFDACMLSKELQKLGEKEKWVIMSKVWVEMLSYASSHCRPFTHAQQVSKGGQLITLVWLLMAHFGLGEQFQINEGHARAKLIVGK
ncbi:hypothetical protein F2P56_033963 [Juglans regia]|uniref:Uncharacterized protein LOC118344718 n=3 Tax=Juglans regia TaxID=51240 RepID=A0A6P9E387_JUGRE|nr:uncharacterized protein LOC118344718 [Juglans regia]KAF5444866.1 hypothetical protein F2P56_033963 [Juglans regia]